MIHEDVYEIARQYLRKVKKTGSENIMALCPFHDNQNSPSFTMSLTRGLYFCFSCQEKGNLHTFLRNVGVTRVIIEHKFSDLIDQLAKNTPRKMNPLKPGLFSEDPLPEMLLGMFDFCPTDLLDEGFQEDLLQKYDIGFDKSNMRVTYPLRDLSGKLVGISGRTVIDAYPKYKIYDEEYKEWDLPERRLDKRFVLWNSDRVYPGVYFQKNARVILVEGFKACLWLVQHGYKDTMALLGTYMSPEHQWILERIGGEVYVMLDNDEPGRVGAARVASQLAVSLNVKIVEYSEEKQQPSDLAPEEIHQALESATDYYSWATEARNKWLTERIRPFSARPVRFDR